MSAHLDQAHAAAGLLTEERAWARRRPALWLSGLIVLSTVVRFAVASATAAPSIFPDDLVYTDLARELARSLTLPPLSIGPLYPILLAPVFLLTHDATQAYGVVKLLNCVLVSLAAVPAFLLARRLLEQRAALFFALAALLVPALVYSSNVMTESIAYPLFLAAVLGIQRTVERPSARRQVEALAVIALAILARPEMTVLVPAFASAVLAAAVLGAHDENAQPGLSVWRRLAPYRLVWCTAAAFALLGTIGWAAVRFRLAAAPASRADVSLSRFDLLAAPRMFVYHLAEVELAAGVLPFLASVLLVLMARTLPAARRTFVVCAASIGAWMLLLVALYATQPLPHSRIFERYTFYVIPLLVLGLLVWFEQGRPRPGRTRLIAAAAAALPLAIPFGEFLAPRESTVFTATVGLVPWALARLAFDSIVPVYVGTALFLLCCWLLFVSAGPDTVRRLRLVVVVYFLAVGLVVNAVHLILASNSARLGVGRPSASWIDQRLGSDAHVAAIWSGTARAGWHSGYPIWDAAFFNRSLRTVYTLPGSFGLWAATPLRLQGTLALADGKPITSTYVLADPKTKVVGQVLGRDGNTGMTLYQVQGPLRLRVDASASR